MRLNIQHNKEAKQFYALVEGKTCKLDYSTSDNGKVLDFRYTFVPEELRGRGIAEEIVKHAMDYAKDNHCNVITSCSYVKHFADSHPEYQHVIKK